MKKFIKDYSILVLALLLLNSCAVRKSSENDQPPNPMRFNDDEKCYRNGKLSIEERKSIYPFSESATVEIISFDSELGSAPVSKSVNYEKVIDRIILSPENIDKLTDILYNYNYSKKKNVGVVTNIACYLPRHAIVFLNSDGSVISFIEICFECNGYKSELPEQSSGVFCDGKYELLNKFFEKAGVKYFGGSPK